MTLASTPERPHHGQYHGSPSDADDRPKTVLFCPCGREAPVEAWQTEPTDDQHRLVCPDCGETLTVR
jgi:hypothetical protein